jgi:hypothetical protein
MSWKRDMNVFYSFLAKNPEFAAGLGRSQELAGFGMDAARRGPEFGADLRRIVSGELGRGRELDPAQVRQMQEELRARTAAIGGTDAVLSGQQMVSEMYNKYNMGQRQLESSLGMAQNVGSYLTSAQGALFGQAQALNTPYLPMPSGIGGGTFGNPQLGLGGGNDFAQALGGFATQLGSAYDQRQMYNDYMSRMPGGQNE